FKISLIFNIESKLKNIGKNIGERNINNIVRSVTFEKRKPGGGRC
ncbi:unnamed protein product, partial [marine sediment metagenome]